MWLFRKRMKTDVLQDSKQVTVYITTTTTSVAVFKCGSKFFGTALIKRWSLCSLLNLDGLRILGPIECDRSATIGLLRLRQKRPKCFHLVILGCSQWETKPENHKEVRVPKSTMLERSDVSTLVDNHS